jgi:hypothetical protein
MPPWSGGASKDAIIAGNNRSRCKAFTRSSPNPEPSRPIHQTRRSRVSPATRRHPPPRETAAQHPTPRCSLPNAKLAPQQRRERTHTLGRRPGILISGGKAVAGDIDWTPHAVGGRRPDQPPRASRLGSHAASARTTTSTTPAAPRNAMSGAAHASATAWARQAQIEPAWPRSSRRGRARGHLPPRPRRPPHRSHHSQQAQTADGGSSRTDGCRREPQLAGKTARRREEKGPAAAAPTGLCPTKATGDGRREGGGGGWPVVAGLGRRPSRPWGERRGGEIVFSVQTLPTDDILVLETKPIF